MIETVLKLMRKSRSEAEGLETFSKLLLASTAEQGLGTLEPGAVARFAQAAFELLLRKPHKRHVLRLRETDLLAGREGSPARLDVIEILDDDMPFVVESVMAELHVRQLVPRLVLHPIFKVKRYGSGRLQSVVGAGDRYWAAGDQESYIALVLDPLGPDVRAVLSAALDAVLEDVRAAASDGDAMRARIAQAADHLEKLQLAPGATVPGQPAPLEVREAAAFLRWLVQGNFTLLGARDFDLVGTDRSADLWPASAGALGIARKPYGGSSDVSAAGAAPPVPHGLGGPATPLAISKSATASLVRRRVPLDVVAVRRYGAGGRPLGELRLTGLFTPSSYSQPVEAVPIVRQKVRRVLEQAGYPADSHSGRTLIDILETFPRDELLQIEPERLQAWAVALLDLELRPRTRVLIRPDGVGRYYSALVFVPRDHYSSTTRERIGRYLEQRLGGRVSLFNPYFPAGPLVRVQLVVSCDARPPGEVDEAELERGVVDLIETWEERLARLVARVLPASRTAAVQGAFGKAFSAGYVETFSVERAMEDIARIERLGPERPVAIDFYRETGAQPAQVRAAVYRFDAPIPLSERVPLLENLGFRVIDERSWHVRPLLDGRSRDVILHDIVLETCDGGPIELEGRETHLEEAFLAVFHGAAENDAFNRLVVAAGLDWREAAVLRALAAFMRQMRSPFGPRYVADTLARYPAIARDLHALFAARHDPRSGTAATAREEATTALRRRIEAALAGVQGLDEDRVLRRLLNLVLSVVRTNAFVRDAAGRAPPTLAFKLASREIERLPEPRPFREIFVSSPRVEGVHLRFAPIARGGIRWSDRPQDFRTEVLGLAKAQQVKNTVIVPSGAKGGFVPRQLSRSATREETQTEGIACYRLFIEALLSLTDDIRDGRVVGPSGILRLDGDDPYLVVAADKGTATFSDDANAIALERGYWLGDAFASGGSAGYDHKKLGITARGAWECVKRHFREMDVDIQSTGFTCVGVGDMSGDVFGNAMLLSPVMALVAAFDHRDIFIDPSPDPELGLAERRRLFALPRSSWADYDRSRISAGGGVFSRAAKSIPLSGQMKALLGVTADAMPPAELIQAVLRAETDLLFFGGIGTFVRESQESDDEVGDRANDAVRITAAELRARVIGEGANLAVTQRARIEAAQHGIRLDTDFIDNSAGVNTSDQEVNIKIALEPLLASGRLARDERNRLLAAMAPEVAASVLANNHSQGLALSLAERTSHRDMAHLSRLTRQLEERGLIDRKLEALPTGAEINARAAAGKGLTRPELAVLLSWAKIALDADVLASDLPDAPAAAELLSAYFPTEIRNRFAPAIAAHPLHREIVAIAVTNTVVNTGGPAQIARLQAEVEGDPAEIVRAILATREIFALDRLWAGLDALDGRVPGQLQLELYQRLQDFAFDETVRLVRQRRGRSMPEMVAAYRPAAAGIAAGLDDILAGGRRAAGAAELARLTAAGVPAGLATVLAHLDVLRQTLPLADRAAASRASVADTARVLLAVEAFLRYDEIVSRAASLQPSDGFDRQAIDTARSAIEAAAAAITACMLSDRDAWRQPLESWAAAHDHALLAVRPVLDAALADPGFSVARIVVVADALRRASTSTP